MLPVSGLRSWYRLIFSLLFIAGAAGGNTEFCQARQASSKRSAPVATKGSMPATIKTGSFASGKHAPVKEMLKTGSKLFLWKVNTDTGATMYLLGTIHVFRRDFYPLPAEIEKALEKSKALLLEVAPPPQPENESAGTVEGKQAEQTKLMSPSLSKLFYQKPDCLAKHISKTTLALLQRYCASIDVPESKYMRMLPWFASFYIEYFELGRLGYYARLGIDEHLRKEAKAKGKKVLGLETVDFHDNVVAGISPELQDKMLKHTLIDLDEKSNDHELSIFQSWMTGNDKAMVACLTRDEKKYPDMAPVENRILYDRNETITESLEPYLKGKDTFMVAVGSAHMVGEKGIVELLKRKGCKVSQVLVGDEI